MSAVISPPPRRPVSVYIHWPFCVSKCPYCDFNSHVRDGIDNTTFADAYLKELQYYLPLLQTRGVRSVFFGGGTPSLMPPDLTAALLNRLRPFFGSNTEITLEANPSSAERGKLRAFRAAGVNRLSVGVQSFRDDYLRFLGRAHGGKEARRTVETATDIFGDRVSFDMIYACKGMTLRQWRADITEALRYGTKHLSLYQLTVETGTPFYYLHKEGKLTVPEDDDAAAFHAVTAAVTGAAGLVNYEVSNYAAPGFESRHNLQYWRYGDYIGIGPGAHGRYVNARDERRATITVHHPEKWRDTVLRQGHGIQKERGISEEEAVNECLLAGLRLREGVNLAALAQAAGGKPRRYINGDRLEILKKERIIALDNARLRCTPANILRHHAVIAYITDFTSP